MPLQPEPGCAMQQSFDGGAPPIPAVPTVPPGPIVTVEPPPALVAEGVPPEPPRPVVVPSDSSSPTVSESSPASAWQPSHVHMANGSSRSASVNFRTKRYANRSHADAAEAVGPADPHRAVALAERRGATGFDASLTGGATRHDAAGGIGTATGELAHVTEAAARIVGRAPIPTEVSRITLHRAAAVAVRGALVGRRARTSVAAVALVRRPAFGAVDVANSARVVASHAASAYTPLHAGLALTVGLARATAGARSTAGTARAARAAVAAPGSVAGPDAYTAGGTLDVGLTSDEPQRDK